MRRKRHSRAEDHSHVDSFSEKASELTKTKLRQYSLPVERMAYLCACARAKGSPQEMNSLYEHLRYTRRLMRPKLSYEEREMLFMAIGYAFRGWRQHSSVVVDEEETFEQLAEFLTTTDVKQAFQFMHEHHLLPNEYPVESYSVRTLRNALETFQHFVHEWPYHEEMRRYLDSLERHVFLNLMGTEARYELSSPHAQLEEMAPVEDVTFDEFEWCTRAVTTNEVSFSCNSACLRSVDCYFFHLDESLRMRERWKYQVELDSVDREKLLDSIEKNSEAVFRSTWRTEMLQDQLEENFAAFFSFPGEKEIAVIGEPDFTEARLGEAEALSRTRPRELTKITSLSVAVPPLEIFERRKTLHRDVFLQQRLRRDASIPYNWRVYSAEEESFENKCTEQAFTLAYLCLLEKNQNLGDVQTKEIQLQSRGGWSPKNPRLWTEYPRLVQCNDYRVHVAVDADTLLVCPNVETAYLVWQTLSLNTL